MLIMLMLILITFKLTVKLVMEMMLRLVLIMMIVVVGGKSHADKTITYMKYSILNLDFHFSVSSLCGI